MELGATVCTAARPRCQICPLRSFCSAYAAWRSADESVFIYQPVRQPVSRVAERQAPFATTTRYFRGRIIAALRALDPGSWISLAELGPQVKPDWAAGDHAWLLGLVRRLADEGLLELDSGADRVRLPS